ncbi:MAG TPA: ceramide glucosyltransferase [Thermoleophilia bacterium]|nr:ceramide glucosyltransferase [Thermoleophilia bacterium]
MITTLEILLLVSITFAAAQFAAAWRHLSRPGGPSSGCAPPRGNEDWTPPVSILKPITGFEDGLRANLETFLHLDYPDYEIVFCLQDPEDPALPLLKELRAQHPRRDVSIVVSDYSGGLNPKICNLIPGYDRARRDLVLVSDANVRVRPDYLREAVSHMRDPHVGLVTHVVRGAKGTALGADLDNGYLNSFVVGAVALFDLVGISCVIGKSMLMRRRDLERLGGLEAVQDYLAEDFALSARFKRAGFKVVISPYPVDRVAMRGDVRSFVRRYTRWNTMRRTIAGPAYLFEALANPSAIAVALVAAAVFGLGPDNPTIFIAGAAVGVKMALDAGTQILFGVPVRAREVLLAPMRDLILFYVWAAGLCSRTISWRNTKLVVGRGSRLKVPDARPIRQKLKDPSSLPGIRRVVRARRPAAS